MATMTGFGERLKAARSRRALSLHSAAGAAKISTAYLHKLEKGRVANPSPRVLERLAAALDISYLTLMELAGYLTPEGHGRAVRKEDEPMTPAEAPTNAELLRILGEIRTEIEGLRRVQQEMLLSVDRLAHD